MGFLLKSLATILFRGIQHLLFHIHTYVHFIEFSPIQKQNKCENNRSSTTFSYVLCMCMQEYTWGHQCLKLHTVSTAFSGTVPENSVSTRKCQEKQSTHQISTECAKRGRRDVPGSFCSLQGEGLQLHCTCYTRGKTKESQAGQECTGAASKGQKIYTGWPVQPGGADVWHPRLHPQDVPSSRAWSCTRPQSNATRISGSIVHQKTAATASVIWHNIQPRRGCTSDACSLPELREEDSISSWCYHGLYCKGNSRNRRSTICNRQRGQHHHGNNPIASSIAAGSTCNLQPGTGWENMAHLPVSAVFICKIWSSWNGKGLQAAVEYYHHHIDPEVTASTGRWILEPLGIYNGYSGVTTNQSEGFNTLLKTFTLRKESTIDSIMLALYVLECYFSNEIQRD